MAKKTSVKKTAVKKPSIPTATRKGSHASNGYRSRPAGRESKGTQPAAPIATAAATAGEGVPTSGSPRLLPRKEDLRELYTLYTAGHKFDEHDKAFYFVLDIGGVSRARQLISHVEEVLAELEEFGR